MTDINHKGDEPYRDINPRVLQAASVEQVWQLERRVEMLERTLKGMQILLGKASEYEARPKKGRLPG